MVGREPERVPLVILGAGPAGLGAAFRLARRGRFDVTVLERQTVTGGNAGSFELDGLPVDYGSHRLHPACPPHILADIRALLGPDLLDRPRHGRIRLGRRWLRFPLRPVDLAVHVPPGFALGVLRDSVLPGRRIAGDDSFATVLGRSLGRTICREFYFPYARKIWGLDPADIDAEQARRRVSAASLGKMLRKVANAVPGIGRQGGARFFYPRGGYGRISEAYRAAAEAEGARVECGRAVTRIELDDASGCRVVTVAADEREASWCGRLVLSTVPLPVLARLVVPAAPADVLASAAALAYRAMLLVYLVLDTDRFTEYDAHYFPDAGVPVSRLSEPKNYGLAVAPDTTVLCAEVPLTIDSSEWRMSDADAGRLVQDALAAAGLPVTCRVRRIVTRRLPQAYPIYARGYRPHFERLDGWASGLDRIVSFGRQGLFVHDNTHHALAMAYALEACLTDRGDLDRGRWAESRRAFESHVVED